AVDADTREAIHAALVDFGMVREGKSYDFETARMFLRGFYGPMLRDEVCAIEPGEAVPLRKFMGQKRELLKLRMPREMMFLIRIRFGVMSVLSRLGARANWYRLERRYAGLTGRTRSN